MGVTPELADALNVVALLSVVPLCLLAFHLGCRKGEGAGRRLTVRWALTLLAERVKDPSLGAVVWRKMVANRIRAGVIEPTVLVTSDIQVWHRLPEDDRQVVLGAAQATLEVLSSALEAAPSATADSVAEKVPSQG